MQPINQSNLIASFEKIELKGKLGNHTVVLVKESNHDQSHKIQKIAGQKAVKKIEVNREGNPLPTTQKVLKFITGFFFKEKQLHKLIQGLPKEQELSRVAKAKASHWAELDPERSCAFLKKQSVESISIMEKHGNLSAEDKSRLKEAKSAMICLADYESQPDKVLLKIDKFGEGEVKALVQLGKPETLVKMLISLVEKEKVRTKKSGQEDTFLRENNGTSRILSAYYERFVPKDSLAKFMKGIRELEKEFAAGLDSVAKTKKNLRTEKDAAFLSSYSQALLNKALDAFSHLPREITTIHAAMGEPRALGAFFLRCVNPKIINSKIKAKVQVSVQVQLLANLKESVIPKEKEAAKQMRASLNVLQKGLVMPH